MGLFILQPIKEQGGVQAATDSGQPSWENKAGCQGSQLAFRLQIPTLVLGQARSGQIAQLSILGTLEENTFLSAIPKESICLSNF
jgi:hypothetical protein